VKGPRDVASLASTPDLIRLAARGDLTAQRQIFRRLLDTLPACRAEQVEEVLGGAELAARMAASWGDPSDRKALAGLLQLRAELPTADHDQAVLNSAECLVLLNRLAAEGDEQAAESVALLFEQ
jgi:hypothetical protein